VTDKYEPSAGDLLRGENQVRVSAWVHLAFGKEAVTNPQERSMRAVEEVVELAQVVGVTAETLHRLVNYVFSRPVGTAESEVAGSMVTIYAAATSLNVNADAALEKELVRLYQPEVLERCRRRQAEKRRALVGIV